MITHSLQDAKGNILKLMLFVEKYIFFLFYVKDQSKPAMTKVAPLRATT